MLSTSVCANLTTFLGHLYEIDRGRDVVLGNSLSFLKDSGEALAN
jgi:hypothetical protein